MSSGDEDPTEREADDELNQTSGKDRKGCEKKEGKVSLFTYFKFIWAVINSAMVSLTRHLNHYSDDYRYVRKVLAKEKKLLKVRFLNHH